MGSRSVWTLSAGNKSSESAAGQKSEEQEQQEPLLTEG